MTQLGEAVAIGIIGPSKDMDCPFHDDEKHEHDSAKNDMVGDATELGKRLDAGGEDSSTVLRTAAPYDKYLKQHTKAKEKDPDETGFTVDLDISNPKACGYPVGFSAHHLIPAKESLDRAKVLHKFMKKGKTVCCNLGYDVNGHENGVWLPALHGVNSKGIGVWGAGGYALPDKESDFKIRRIGGREYIKLAGPTPGSKNGADAFSDKNLKWKYIQKATKAHGNKQFHDRHADYSKLVRKHLEDVAKVLEAFYGTRQEAELPGCDKCKESHKKGEKPPPPPGLLGLLNNSSKKYRSFVDGFSAHATYYTSSWGKPAKTIKRKSRPAR